MKNATKKAAKTVVKKVEPPPPPAKPDPILTATKKAIAMAADPVAASAALAVIEALLKEARKSPNRAAIEGFLGPILDRVRKGGGQDGGDSTNDAPPRSNP